MGCAASSINEEEKVKACRERKKLMKQLIGFRKEFADALLIYLRALKNTGATLRQFTESETLEFEDTIYGLASPPSPPPPLPPSPPPPPPFSPDLRKHRAEDGRKDEFIPEGSIVTDDDEGDHSPSPPILSSSWEHWDPFEHSSVHQQKKSEIVGPVEEENWVETRSEFEEEAVEDVVNPEQRDLVNCSSSTTSLHMKFARDMGMISWKKKKTLGAVVKELDEYFLKASSGIKEIAVLIDISVGNDFQPHNFRENKRKRSSSAKVFNALSRRWSSNSLQFTTDTVEFCGSNEPCRPGAHCITLQKLYAVEQRLQKDVKEEEVTNLEREKKALILQRQEDEHYDRTKTEKTFQAVESLETDIIRLRQAMGEHCASILALMDEELYPQLVALTSGLLHMWKMMSECHQIQNEISQQLSHQINNHDVNLSTDYHRQATAQLAAEITVWYNSFCNLVKYQREYVKTLHRWTQLTEFLVDHDRRSVCSSVVLNLCENWQNALERLPDKAASEAIKNLLSAINSLLLQQVEEQNLQRKYEKLDKRLQKEMHSLAEMERKLGGSFVCDDGNESLSPKNPLSIKRAKTDALKKLVDTEKAKYLNSVEVGRSMTLNHLKTGLPNVFQALMGFASASVQAMESVCSHVTPKECRDDATVSSTN
ncbi:nitrate regulatory gene2 protein-like [Cucurbita pepo subsp. pepo]|uniref:nitrate regulatory gene2 protein-like n=1 Tax=Cucurbita pepo subsp. pepo TaxID=3664 RepID=UPI000C9D57AE|nr:nitrate regulatory gene2 protein-like [Cucurbita pepo subsp. pepo]XP_023541719.1 nitrate regulatory gene2 protein-like [Cucurbita pepo subsp. pepo]